VNPTILSDPRTEVREFVRRHLFGISGVACLGGALQAATNGAASAAARALVALGFVLVAAFSLAAWRRPGLRSNAAIALVCGAGLVLVSASALSNGSGLNAPGIGFLAVFTFLLAATVNARFGVAIALASLVTLLGLGWAEWSATIPGATALAAMPIPRRLITQVILLAVALSGGLLVTRVVEHYLGAGREREQRFQRLLGIAADSYWEMDPAGVITAVWRRGAGGDFEVTPPPPQPPWDQPDLLHDAGALAAHQADLAARRPFRDLHVRSRRPEGGLRHELVSGEPRFAADGRFLGYWGVSRDISDRVAGAEALRRSEAMLSHLVTTSPDLITLTDLATGRYVMVNEAFAGYTGYTVAEAIGRTSLELGVWGDTAARDTFVQRLEADGTVRDLPCVFVAKSGARLSLLVSAATFELEGGRFLVLNGRDVTASERTRLAHEAVLENASLGIAFTRDRIFMQANPALEEMLGRPRGTLAGQPGRVVWRSEAEYAEIGALIGPALARGESVEFVRELVRLDGTTFWCRMLAKAVDPAHPMAGGTIWIVEDITERKRVDEALAKARDDAEAASRAKSAFLANTSHEIRTPLNGLVGLARLARRPGLEEKRRGQYLDQIAESAETLAEVISDVLDLSKIESGKLEIERIPFSLHELLASLHRVYATLAEARGLSFSLRTDAAVPQGVFGDPVRLRQVLGNYLNNALKFTAHGEIALATRVLDGDTLRFEVSDTGPGIAPEIQPRLFRPFTQADQSTTRRFGGSGLGLSICRELATLMDGHVGVDSMPGRGSCFWAELPLPQAATPQAELVSPDDASDTRLAGARVLMVEDNPVNMTIAIALLEQWGVEVEQAGDGAQALGTIARAAAEGRPFDIVLMDVQMPVMSGYEATRRLRAAPWGESLPVIALTAAALTSERDEALASGMDGFLTKPIDARRLREALAAMLERAARTR
jgi:PAS domain S-box-containing protein